MDNIFELESLEDFSDVSREILTNLYSSKHSTDIALDANIIQAAKEDVKKLISNGNYHLTEVSQTLRAKGLHQERVNLFVSLLEEKMPMVLYTVLLHHNSAYGETVTDFNWLLKMVLGTNDLKTLRYPLLQLILSTVNADSEHKREVYDLNKEMLAKLISILENMDEIQ